MNPIDRLNAITEENPVFKFVLNNGTIEFRNKYNELHNIDDPPAVIEANGSKHWYQNGLCHRDNDKPAVITSNNTQKWFKFDKLHREHLSAVIYPNGSKEFWINGKHIPQQELELKSCIMLLYQTLLKFSQEFNIISDPQKPN